MSDHHKRNSLAQFAIRSEILRPYLIPAALDRGEFLVCIEISSSQSGKVLAAAKNICSGEPFEKSLRVSHYLLGIVRNGSRGQYLACLRQVEVEHRREIYIESQGPNLFTNDAAVFFKQLLGIRAKNVGGRGRRSDDVAQAIDRAAFQVDAAKERSLNCRLADAQQLRALMRRLDVSRKQDHATRMHAGQQAASGRRDLRPLEAHDQKLSNAMTQRK